MPQHADLSLFTHPVIEGESAQNPIHIQQGGWIVPKMAAYSNRPNCEMKKANYDEAFGTAEPDFLIRSPTCASEQTCDAIAVYSVL